MEIKIKGIKRKQMTYENKYRDDIGEIPDTINNCILDTLLCAGTGIARNSVLMMYPWMQGYRSTYKGYRGCYK